MADSPSKGSDGPVDIEIKSAGNVIPDTYGIFSVRTRTELNRVAEAVIVLGDGDIAKQEFPISDSADFEPGTEIEIKAGYKSVTKTIFKGIVTAMRLRIDGARQPRLEVTCRHEAVKLLAGKKRAVYKDKKDSDIIAEVAGDVGVSIETKATVHEHAYFVRHQSIDWDFIVNRAEANGLVAACTPDGTAIKPPDFTGQPGLTVTFGEDLISYDMEVSARGQFTAWDRAAWSPAEQELLAKTALQKSGNPFGNLEARKLAEVLGAKNTNLSSVPNPTAEIELKARATRADLALAQGNVVFQGNAVPQPNTVLELKGLGDRFSGNGLIGGVVHRIDAGSWTTEVHLGLPAALLTDNNALDVSPGNDMVPARRGLAIGKVTRLDEDPDQRPRIQVEVPEFDEGKEPIWAQLGLVYASTNAGLMFLPEVGDEVVLGFLDDDPSQAVILGSLHNPKTYPPEGFAGYDAENNTKAIVTRSNIKVTFDDDKKILTLDTPGGNKFVLDDEAQAVTVEDQGGSSVTLNSGGITLDSSADIAITASGGVSITAGSDVSISGVNVKAEGSSGFTGSGGGSAEVSAGGTMTVKGAMVMIN